MKENKKYTANDFVRYHSGAMPPNEMHALEKAALENPFLADALEGYKYSTNPEKELDEIKMQLAEKRKRNHVFSLYSLSSGSWWKIAAMFILIAGAGYFFFYINSQKEPSFAVKKKQLEKENPATIPPIKNDTAATEGNLAFQNKAIDKNKNNTAKFPSPTAKSIEIPPPKKTAQEEMRTGREKEVSEGYLADKKEKITAMNSDKAVSSDIITKDSGEKPFFRSLDTTGLVAASPKVYARDTDNIVAMNKRNPALEEIVVTGYGSRKKSTISQELEGNVSGVAVTKVTVYPKEGKEYFDRYIKDNAVPVFDSTGEKIPADILLSFSVDKNGKPTHVKILKSSCKACEKEAIRLLKEGPEWAGKRGTKGTIRIQF